MRQAWANLAILALVAVQIATGLVGLLGATEPFRVAFWLHAIGGYAIFVVVVGKSVVIADAVSRRPQMGPSRAVPVLMVLLLTAVLVSGLVWVTGGRRTLGGISLINWHAYLAIALAVPLAWHVLDRRWVVRVPGAADRRAFLHLAGALAVGAVVWQAERLVQRALGLPGGRRRWTGSYEVGSGTGSFPVTSWLDDDPAPVDPGAWRLQVDGAVARPLSLTLADLAGMADEAREEVLDCTGGWWSRQPWRGVPLARLVAIAGPKEDARSVSVESVTGYARRFSLDHAGSILLATGVAGAPLSHGHGAPARLVVPGRRGYDWVKWVVRVRVLDSSHLWQPPLPIT